MQEGRGRQWKAYGRHELGLKITYYTTNKLMNESIHQSMLESVHEKEVIKKKTYPG